MPRDRGPGPKYLMPSLTGYNYHDPTRQRAPGYSFGSRYSYQYKESPGPYAVDGNVSNRGRDNNEGFSLAGRPSNSFWENKRKEEQPTMSLEPNHTATEPSSPRYSFGSPRKYTFKTEGPGPVYNLGSTIGHGPAARIYGRNPRLSFHYDKSRTPGPTYNPTSRSCQGFTMGSRNWLPGNHFVTPGPIYNPSMSGNVQNSPRFSMGIRHHPDVLNLVDVSD